jgi:hypothetical protein
MGSMKTRTLTRFFAPWMLAIAVLLAGGCGGGGGGGGGTPPAHSGSLSISLAGAALPAQVGHVWITLTAVALNADADKPWSGTDASWQVVRFAQPLTLDLATLTNGTAQPLAVGLALPPGSYGQMRLFLLAHDAALADSAKALQLAYNDQVDYTDGTGSARRVPLELPDVGLGLRINGPVTVTADTHTDITVQWDPVRSLVRLAHDDGIDRFTLRPHFFAYDAAYTGAIVGVIDKSQFCAAGAPAADCIHGVVASAVQASPDGRFKRSVRSAPVIVGSSYALFSLYPLPALAQGQTFDVVITGRNMRTMVVRDVPAQPKGLLEALPTRLGANPADPTTPVPMVPVLQAQGDAQLSLSTPMAHSSARLLFGQTLPGDSTPVEIATANVDVYGGRLAQPVPLPGGPLQVAVYRGDTVLSFADVAPQEGTGSYSVMALGNAYEDPSAPATLAAPAGSVAFTAPEPTPHAGLGVGTLSVTIAAAPAGRYDAAQLVVADANRIVGTRDVSALLAAGGSVDIALPAGSAAASLGGTAVYAVALRAWKRSTPAAVQWARAAGSIDLRSSGTASASLSLP